jgi:hypothetical protein
MLYYCFFVLNFSNRLLFLESHKTFKNDSVSKDVFTHDLQVKGSEAPVLLGPVDRPTPDT